MMSQKGPEQLINDDERKKNAEDAGPHSPLGLNERKEMMPIKIEDMSAVPDQKKEEEEEGIFTFGEFLEEAVGHASNITGITPQDVKNEAKKQKKGLKKNKAKTKSITKVFEANKKQIGQATNILVSLAQQLAKASS